MQERMKKRPTEGGKRGRSGRSASVELVALSESGTRRREHFEIPAPNVAKLRKVLQELESALEEEFEGGSVSAADAFADLDAKYTSAGAALRGAREKEGLTQSALAEKLGDGVKQSHISLMESGNRPIGKGMAKRLAEALKIDYRVFL